LTAGTAAVALLAGALFFQFRRGFDFTDEGAQPLSIARPRDYPSLHSLSCFILNPLYEATGRNLALFRSAWLVLTFSAAFALAASCVRAFCPLQAGPPRAFLLALALLLSAGSVTYLAIWFTTPDYNSLNFIAVCLFAKGILDLAAARRRPRPEPDLPGGPTPSKALSSAAPGYPEAPGPSPAEWKPSAQASFLAGQLCLACGVWLSFMARPFTAPALILIAFLGAAGGRGPGPRALLLPAAAAFGLLAFTVVYVDGPPGPI
jgi:hypothetical protein